MRQSNSGGSNCKPTPNLTFPPLVSLHDTYSGYHGVPWSLGFHPYPPQSAAHTQPQGTCRHFRGFSSSLPFHLLRIKCKVFANNLPARHKNNFQPIPLGTQASNCCSNNTAHFLPRAFGPPAPSAYKNPSPCCGPKTDSITLSRPQLKGHLLRKAGSGYRS